MTYMDYAVEGRSDHQSKENFATWAMDNGHDWGLGLFMKPVSARGGRCLLFLNDAMF